MRRSLRASTMVGAALTLAVTVAGCGGTAGNTGSDSTGNAKGSISIETARGVVKLDQPASEVVSLEWAYTEELLALGVTPVGNADNSGYSKWVNAPGTELPSSVTDVGTRSEPSLEKIKALTPDLIVANKARVGDSVKQLKSIAPVLVFDATSEKPLKRMRKNFTELAEAVGKQDKAAKVLDKLETKAKDIKQRLKEAGKADAKYALAQGLIVNGQPSIRMFTDGSLAAQVVNMAGLTNAWNGKSSEYGMTTVGVEALTKLPADTHFMYISQKDPFTGPLADNPVWTGLEFVKKNQVDELDPGTWVFGGPLSAMYLLDETAKAFGV